MGSLRSESSERPKEKGEGDELWWSVTGIARPSAILLAAGPERISSLSPVERASGLQGCRVRARYWRGVGDGRMGIGGGPLLYEHERLGMNSYIKRDNN